MKTCFKCHRALPLTDFYKHPAMADGYLGKCKDCTRDDVTEHRIKNIGRIREYDRDRSSQPQRALLRSEITQRDRATYPERYRARMAVARALKKGVLMKPDQCQRCGVRPSRIEAHHKDYGAPLEVEWLCKPCHYKADEERRAA